ncbi:malto-oligosyltrehalose synthase [Nitrosococcus wardiae]|uniref:malto-oligosyltrehalose synthase n=1 Tax=Nitrosococcus wardiae TaxID=1814290 RepID=UPI001F0D6F09|nr:malto-oligosyltrehalose synthase [Nitrosococcus wardiae]
MPRVTYRLQFNNHFTFADAEAIVPYLHELGISHCYASPYLKARLGSPHGYDIVDHNALNPEIGDRDTFASWVQALHCHGMGQILDIVPNHMGVGGDDNAWWLDVLEQGPASEYAAYFDIDWRPIKEELRGKVLLPLLGDHYGRVLEKGELRLTFDLDQGQFSIWFYNHRFPVDPSTYPDILGHGLERLAEHLAEEEAPFLEYQSLITAFEHLPSRYDTRAEKRVERLRDCVIYKRRLAESCRKYPAIGAFVFDTVATFNGVVEQPESFDLLHHLLESQAYRLAYWQVASDEINYRRFFDINDLAGLRMENPEVFETTHRFILDLVKEGKVDGLRIDHPDGLYNPPSYYQRLNRQITEIKGGEKAADGNLKPSYYLVIEKILASYEHLPESWPISGTTGYEFAYVNNGLFVYPASQKEFDQIYTRFIRHQWDFDELLYERKKIIIRVQLSSELTVLANMLNSIAQTNRHTRDFTLNGLREALTEVVACFPVYRTYVDLDRVSEEDRRFIQWAVIQAKKRSPAADISIFDFIQAILLLEMSTRRGLSQEIISFVMRFQQYTGPVMAKALEDTVLYIYNRLISLNDVGSDPRNFGVSLTAFHRANQERAQRWPYGMVTSSTHDSKRSEDVRARLNVLSEMPGEWRKHLSRWARINRAKIRRLNGFRAPSRNDEYLFYQTVLGTWPLLNMGEEKLAEYRDRIEAYMLKAIKEAKVHTSWINPDTEYEAAVIHFVRNVLGSIEKNPFLADFLPFQRRVARFGLLNSLSQLLLKLTVPGVPDIYQGNELWEFRLVDPDNRHPVDFTLRWRMLQELMSLIQSGQSLRSCTYELLKNKEDGRVKLYLTWKVLSFRAQFPLLFQKGDYIPLSAQGVKADHLCAFARKHQGQMVVSIIPRWLALLGSNEDELPLGESLWQETWVEVPAVKENEDFTNVLTGERVIVMQHNGKFYVPAGKLFESFSVALLTPSSIIIPA